MARCDFENNFDGLDRFGDWVEAQRIPCSIHYDVTWHCDLRCAHCYLSQRDQDELTLNEVIRLLDQLADLGTLAILFSGGDPFVRPDFLQIVREARSRWFDVRINTNGLRVDAHCAKQLEKMGVRQVSMSLYSADPAEHDAVTLRPGSFAATMKAARCLYEAGLPINFKTVVTKGASHYQELGEIVEEFHAKWEVTALLLPRNDGAESPLLLGLDDDSMRSFFDWDFKRLQWKPEFPRPRPRTQTVCGAARSSLYIAPNGDLFPCISWNRLLGSIRKTPLSEIWQSPLALKTSAVTRQECVDHCPDCYYNDICDFCPGLGERLTGRFCLKNSSCCQTMQRYLEAIEANLGR